MMNPMGMNPMNLNQIGMNVMNMNNMGMNPMNMNQMGMNQVGINNQFNQMNIMNMDNVTMNVKNLIQPYENKIKELEEIIRQKDFEIAVLKQKLNISNVNNNFMNMNQMMMNQNINQMMILNQEIQLIIKSEEETREITCFEHDKLSKIREKCNIKGFLTYNSRVLDESKSIKENGLEYGSKIEIKPNIISICFKDDKSDINTLILSDDFPIGLAIIYYIIKFENPIFLLPMFNGKTLNDIFFLFNGQKLNVKDITPLRAVFSGVPNPVVMVTLTKNVIGKKNKII